MLNLHFLIVLTLLSGLFASPTKAAPSGLDVYPVLSGWLAHPRSAGTDSFITMRKMDSLFVNGAFPAIDSLKLNGQEVALHRGGRFSLQIQWPEDRFLHFETHSQANPEKASIHLEPPHPRTEFQPFEITFPATVRLSAHPVLSAGQDGSYWQFPDPHSTLTIVGREKGFFEVPLSGSTQSLSPLTAWLSETRVKKGDLLSGTTLSASPRKTGSILRSMEQNGDVIFDMLLRGDGPAVFPIEIEDQGGTLRLRLPNTRSHLDQVILPSHGVRHVDWEVLGRDLELRFDLEPHVFQGHRIGIENGRLRLQLFRKPDRISKACILIDPGHGGSDTGCLASSGISEATVNLFLAEELARQLRRKGATVHLTRDSDVDLPLYDRLDQADSLRVDFLISLHHNSVSARGNPEDKRGFSLYYWSPWSVDFAHELHKEMQEKITLKDDGLRWRSLALCRYEACPSLLLEAGLLVHPEEEDWLLNRGHRRQIARSITHALVTWFRN